MTAINAFQDEDFAYLACDSAYVDYGSGKVALLGFKMFAFNDHRVVVALAGAGLLPNIMVDVSNDLNIDQGDLLKSLERNFLKARKEAVINRPQHEETGLNEITMIATCYLEREARPAILRISSSDATLPGQPVNRWHEMDGFHFPGDYPADTLKHAWVDDPIADSRALFRAQRKSAYPGIARGSGMGGTCTVMRVGRDAVDGWDILEFADKVGAVADIADTGVDVLRTRQIGV